MRLRTVVLVMLAATACNFFEVEAPDRVPASNLDDPTRAPLLVQSAIADFECALNTYIVATGLLTDELYSSTPFNGNAWDLHNITAGATFFAISDCAAYASGPAYNIGLYTPLSTARYDADFAFGRIQAFDPLMVTGRDTLLALAAAYAGYSYTLFGEGFCQAAFDRGPALAPLQVLQRAEQRFDTALAYAGAANADGIVNLARVGQARARLDIATTADSLGDATLAAQERAAAAAEARLVPPGFVRTATRVGGYARLENAIYVMNYASEHVSVDPRFRNLTVGGVPDPRVQAVYAGHNGNDGVTPLWYQLKYTARSSPIVLASWVEAQLIIAEAEGGQSAVDRINALRSRLTPPLPLYPASGDSATIMKQLIEERRRELFLDGHRLGDRLRFHLPWEKGLNNKGGTYRSTTCLPLPTVETDNNDSIP